MPEEEHPRASPLSVTALPERGTSHPPDPPAQPQRFWRGAFPGVLRKCRRVRRVWQRPGCGPSPDPLCVAGWRGVSRVWESPTGFPHGGCATGSWADGARCVSVSSTMGAPAGNAFEPFFSPDNHFARADPGSPEAYYILVLSSGQHEKSVDAHSSHV